MSDRENIVHLTEQLASETSALKRQQLARRIKKEIERFVPGDWTAAPRDQIGEYWKSRAERTRQRARRHGDQGLRDHLLKIANGYDELAKRACSAREMTETQGGKT